MKYLKVKDKKNRIFFKKLEFKKLLSKALLFDLNLPYDLRGNIFDIIKKYQRKHSKVQLRNRCVVSNRARYLFTRYKVSRLAFNKLVVLRRIVGVYKCIW